MSENNNQKKEKPQEDKNKEVKTSENTENIKTKDKTIEEKLAESEEKLLRSCRN